MSQSTLQFTSAVILGAVLLPAMVFTSPFARGQQANSKAQTAQSAKAKPAPSSATNAIPPKSAPKTTAPTPDTQHPLPPQPATLHIPLVGTQPAALQQQAAHVDVDASALGASLPAFWRGNARTPPFGLAGDTSAASPQLTRSGTPPNTIQMEFLRKAAGAALTRLHPFATPGTLTLHPDGTPIVRWESVDAALKQAGEAGEDVIFDVQCPAGLSPQGWRALAEATLRRYRENPPAPIARWEAALNARDATTRYEPFARLARSLYPNTPVGLNLISSDVAAGEKTAGNKTAANEAEAIRRAAQICAQNKVPLDSLAWKFADTPGDATQQAQRIRRILAAFPALKNVFLLPTLPAISANATAAQSVVSPPVMFARPVSFVAHLLDAVPSSPPNALVGALLEETPRPLSGRTDKAGEGATPISADVAATNAGGLANALTPMDAAQAALALLNRMAGTRLRAQSDDGGIGCLAARSQNRVFALLWREPVANRVPTRPTRLPDGGNALIIVRLHHVGLENSNGLRVTQTNLAQTFADALHPVSPSIPVLNAPGPRAKAAGADSPALPPSGVRDAFWNSRGEAVTVPGDVEAPVLLEPGGVCLLEIAPLKTKNPLAVSLTITPAMEAGNGADIYGGDPLNALLTIRNLSARPQTLDVTLASALRDLLPQGAAHFTPGLLPANGGRAFQFALRAPVLGANANVTLNARIGDNAAAFTVPIQAPLYAALESPRADVESGTGRANARIRLTNRSRAPLSVHLQAEENTGTTVQVPPGGKPVVTALAVAPPSREPGLYSVPLRVESGGRVAQILRAAIGVPVLCPYAAVKPVIDGDLKEWSGNVPLGMGRAEQARGKNWGGPADVSAYAYALWDERFFYFACAVTDDVFTPPTRAAELMQGDCVIFALAAPRANAPAASLSYARFGMAVMRNSAGASVPILVRLRADPKTPGRDIAAPVKNARIAVRREDTRTFYEVAIPWSEWLPAPMSPASAVSLAILVNDVDGQAQGCMQWGNGLYGSVNPLLFPPLRLVKTPAP